MRSARMPHLRRRLLAGDVEDGAALARAGGPGRDVEQQGRLADAGLARHEHDGAGHQPAAEHPVELADAGGARLGAADVDLADRQRRALDAGRRRWCGR